MPRALTLLLLLLLAILVVAAAPFRGIEDVPLSTLWSGGDDVKAYIFWSMRVPRVAMALLAGMALATSGMVYQAMFRNPLADPFTLGIASGASLGAVVAIHLGSGFSFWGFSAVSLCAFAGTLLAVGLVYGLARAARGFSNTTMLLAGVAVSFFCSSLILFVQYLSDFTRTFRMLRWTMGGLEDVVSFREVLSLLPLVVSGCLIILYLTHELNLLMTGDELAASRGVEVRRTKLVLLMVTSLMVGAVVALCGPIGFVGLMGPHICRLLVGADHRWLLPATLLFGGAFLVLCDTFARTIMAPAELPVGILTSLLGGPFFLWLLLRRRSGVELL